MDAFFFPWGAEIELKKNGSLNVVLIAFFSFFYLVYGLLEL